MRIIVDKTMSPCHKWDQRVYHVRSGLNDKHHGALTPNDRAILACNIHQWRKEFRVYKVANGLYVGEKPV